MAIKKAEALSTVKQEGTQIVVPEGMTLEKAIDHLTTRMKQEEQTVNINEDVDAFVWDGAICFQRAIKEMFGWSDAVPEKTFFGENPPRMISIETGYKETTLVPWGDFKIPTITGTLSTGINVKKGQAIFAVSAVTKRKDEKKIRALIQRTRELVEAESLYKGKAFKLRFMDDDERRDPLPRPSFLNLSKVKYEELVFSDDVKNAVETNIFTAIENAEKCRQFKIPLKRGILLYGPYGTGKSLTSYVTAKKCTENGWTFLYCERANELADMVKMAHHFQPAVVFCEDIDRSVSGERTAEMDDILNIIDGIESKGVEIMVILTTNHVEEINQALLRPGRLDAVINVLPPDAVAAQKLVRLYGRGLVPDNANLALVGDMLAGKIPAVIREVVEKAKLTQIRMGMDGGKLVITPEALTESAETMRNQLELLNRKKETTRPALVEALSEIVREKAAAAMRDVCDDRGL